MNFINDPEKFMKFIYLADVDPNWSVNSKMPFGTNIRTIGESGSIASEIEASLIGNGVSHGLFTNEVMEPVRQMLGVDDIDGATRQVNWQIPEEEIARRLDLRSTRIFTIDPSTAKDLDDAVHVECIGDDLYSIG